MVSMRGPATVSYDLKTSRMGVGSGGKGEKIRTAAMGESEGLGHALPDDDGTQGIASGSRATGYATAADNERTMASKAAKPRLDRPGFKKGGRVKGTTVNVIVAPQNAPKVMAPQMPPPGVGPMPMPPPGAGGPPPGMGGPPPGGPPPMMRKRGGRVPMDAGAGGGLGRLEKVKAYGKKAK